MYILRYHWTDAGMAEVARNLGPSPPVDHSALETRRAAWAPAVEKVVELLGGFSAIKRRTKPIWVDAVTG